MTLLTTFDVTLEFLSDWHVGTGQGQLGTIDAEVRRDADKLPFVPAKTLVGVWRDACETVAATFDQAADRSHAWQAWVTWLFGSQPAQRDDLTARSGRPPIPAALRLTPARAPEWLRAGVRGRPALAQAAVLLRPGVAIDDATGTAADRLLRVEERAIRSLQLHSRITVAMAGAGPDGSATPAPLPVPAELLLRAGARLVEAVGGKRNRGSGRVAVLLSGARLDHADGHPMVTDPRLNELLSAGVPATPPPPPAAAELVTFYPYDRVNADGRRTVRVALRVLTPVVVADGVLGNVVSSRDAIPGTALLGTVLSRVAHDGPGRIGVSDVGVGDAVPAVADPADPRPVRPAQPVPRVWQRGDKGRGRTVHNSLSSAATHDERARAMSGWIVRDGDGWRHVDPAVTASTHAVVDDQARRPTIDSGGVYTYLGIAPGTLLCTDIRLPARARLRLGKGERLRFGRSRKDDFGLVEVVAIVDPLPDPPPPVLGDRLRVWCVSDVLLRDKRLIPDPSPQALAETLSAALAPASVEVRNADTATAVTRREGFAVAWGRPRPSQVALRAGSVVTLAVTGTVDPDRLAELERDGIGERTAEGYGRIRFNPPELTADDPAVDFLHRSADPELRPTELPREPHPLEVNAWRRAIRRASAELVPDDLVPGISRLAGNRAQLGSLRAQLERLTLPGGRDMVRHWIEGTKAVPARRKMWEKPTRNEKAEPESVLDELARLLLDSPALLWERLNLAEEQPTLTLAPGREDAIRQVLHTEALTIAVTDALRRLLRQPGNASGPGSGARAKNRTAPSPARTTAKEAR
ncbi:RAMP superfamily CRISPR-associated protein [Micromonospora chalcea]|uniref:RAMP superfamily CRISPR-associated protein n=1 Tax=Micromonospora chalcea TaxID=1874 RepID=UPI003CFACDE0